MAQRCLLLCILLNAISASDGTLRYVQVLFRHGDRAPKHTYASDPHQEDAWPQGWGQLTQEGMRQEYELGQYLRKRYVGSGYIHGNYTADEIHVLSTYQDRAIMSASCMLAGLFPPSGYQIWNPAIPWQPIPIHTLPKEDDFLFEMECPTYDALVNQLPTTDYGKKLEKENQDLLDLIAKHAGYPPTLKSLMDFFDTIYIENYHNLTFPPWLRQNDVYKRFVALKDLKAEAKFATRPMARIIGGPFLGKIMKNFDDFVNFHNITPKIDFFSGHQTNVNALLSVMGMFNQLYITYAGAVLMELHHNETEGYTVEFYFRNDTNVEPYLLTVPGCVPSCPLSRLKVLTRDDIPDDPVVSCLGHPITPPCSTQGSSSTSVNATTVGPTPPSSGTVERKDIECTAGTMDIHIPRSLLPTHNVTLRDPTCVVPSNGTHLVISISFNQCGTTVSFSNDTVVFSNELVATVIQASHPSSIVDYGLSKDDQRVSLECVYKRRSSVELNYMPMMRAAHFYEKRYGNLDFELKHYSDEQFTTEIANTDIPTGVNLNSEIFIDLVVDQHQTKDIGIYVPSCFATPTPSPTDPLFYPLIKSSCPAQADVRRFTAPDINEFRFSFLAFKFTRAPLQKIHASMPAVPMVYIHCQVSACPRGNCTSSCNSANGGRMKRAALGDSSHLISSGPFYLKTDESTTGYSSIVVAVTMSVAVAATVVAMAAIVAWRRSAAKLSAYQSLRMNMDS